MKISLEFDSVREMRELYDGVNFVPYGTIRKVKQEEPKPAHIEEATPEVETSEPTKEETAPAAEEEKLSTEDVRRLLSVINRKSGGNKLLKGWIAEEGFKTFGDVTDKDQEVLKRLKAKAEEVINAE